MNSHARLGILSLATALSLVACHDAESEHSTAASSASAPQDGGTPYSQSTDASLGSTDASLVVPRVESDAGPVRHVDAGGVASEPSGSPSHGTPGSTGAAPGSSDQTVRFFLPTGEPTNTAAPRVEVDLHGDTHTVYPAFFHGDAFYSHCQGDCRAPGARSVVRFETDGTINNAMIRLTSDGRPRVLLAGALHNYWAECDAGCDDRASWSLVQIQDHHGDLEVTGEALALDPQGRPRFLFHTYRAVLGVGQKTPQTSLASCDANCSLPASWSFAAIAQNELWVGSSLAYDGAGSAHVATNVFSFGDGAGEPQAAYLSCAGTCNMEHAWHGAGFFAPYESMTDVVDVHPSISLALTHDGRPRVVQLAKTQTGDRAVVYFECDERCTAGDNWQTGFSLTTNTLADGVDLALDSHDRPRFVISLNYDIALLSCDEADCLATDNWQHGFVERASDIPPDAIFLEYNCNVGGWFLHSPSLAISAADQLRVGYEIRDESAGGPAAADPSMPGCVAGTDMSLSRLAALPSVAAEVATR